MLLSKRGIVSAVIGAWTAEAVAGLAADAWAGRRKTARSSQLAAKRSREFRETATGNLGKGENTLVRWNFVPPSQQDRS
jgi:hypothetical protein